MSYICKSFINFNCMAQKTLKQTRTFNASAKDLYESIMDSRKHAKFSGAPAKISAKVGGKFTAYGGSLEGENLELKPNKKIVQSWRSNDWPAGLYSRATFEFAPAGRGKTKLTFTQSGIPEADFEDIKKGWISFYWEPIAKMMSAKK
jgi:activator of HSP90 ATPase